MSERRPHAYTLIECVLALGLVALVLASLVAVLPVGLASQANGGRRVAEARIMQHLHERCHTAVPARRDLYFNRDGAPLEEITDAVYVALLDPAATAALPGDEAGQLRCVRVRISDHPQTAAVAQDLRVTVHSLLLSPALDTP